MKTVLITGATSGIGRACVDVFVREGFGVVACGRRIDRLREIENKYGQNVRILCFDVAEYEQVKAALDSLTEPFQSPDVLVNNAGNAHGLAPIHQGEVCDWEAMIQSNIQGLLYVSKEISAKMVVKKSGHIINVGSIAGKQTYPSGNVYCATKYAVDALTEGMRLDLNPFGIKVSAINPGLVETEFSLVRFKGDSERAKKTYAGMQPLTAEDIAELIWFMASRPPHVNIADMLVLPTAQASATQVLREN
jgi:NADP-dependent 3-hydroxy acid dehydrogenase YdfG